MKIFDSFDYKKVLKADISENKDEYGYKSKLATAAGCQKSFLSQVLNGHVHLTPEHALGLARFWKLSERERDYFIALVNFGRAGTKELTDYLKEKLVLMKREHENLGKRFEAPALSLKEDLASTYYSAWHFSAIHIGLTIPSLRSTAKIAKRFHLSEELVQDTLQQLKNLGLAEKRADGSWIATKKSLHLSSDSIFNFINL